MESKSDDLERFLHDATNQYQESLGKLPANNLTDNQILLQENDVLILFGSDGKVLQSWGAIILQNIPKLLKSNLGQQHEGIFFSRITTIQDSGKQTADYVFMVSPILIHNTLTGFFLIGSQTDPEGRLDRLMLRLILGGLGTIVLALIGGFWLADRAMRPVKTITQTARELSETDLSRRLHIRRKDEIGHLANTFDEMLDRLETAFERQRRFTADASHELRTPLTIINLEAGRAISMPRSRQEYRHALQVIQSESDFMAHMVNDLLTLARMDAKQITLSREQIDLSDIALDAIERLSPLASRREVKLNVGDLPEIYIQGNRQYLTQMVTNLIENAIKYTASNPDNSSRLIIVETGIDQNKRLGWICISDTGPGIPAEHLPHLFDRFYRVDESRMRNEDTGGNTTMSSSGSGLGLAIAQWIARQHNGNIYVQSQVGHGTKFTVKIPLL